MQLKVASGGGGSEAVHSLFEKGDRIECKLLYNVNRQTHPMEEQNDTTPQSFDAILLFDSVFQLPPTSSHHDGYLIFLVSTYFPIARCCCVYTLC